MHLGDLIIVLACPLSFLSHHLPVDVDVDIDVDVDVAVIGPLATVVESSSPVAKADPEA